MSVFDSRQGDLGIFNTLDGGEIRVVNGEPVLDQGLESAVYLSLEGAGAIPWFANEYLQAEQQITSRFAAYRQGRELTSGVVTTSEDLIKQDLAWLTAVGAADKVDVEMSIVARNRVEIQIIIGIGRDTIVLSPFQLNWDAQDTHPLNERV